MNSVSSEISTVTFQRSRKGTLADRGKGKIIDFIGHDAHVPAGFWNSVRRLGPGIVTGTANVDPSLVVTATVVGAAFQYSLLWVVLLCVPFLLVVFSVSARLGFETRKGLVDLLRENYGRPIALLCVAFIIVINMAMIIADLMAVSDALSIILGQPRMFFIAAVAFSIWYILIFRDYRKITGILLWFSLPLLVYVAAAIASAPDPHQILIYSLLPKVDASSTYVGAIVALFGSLLTPYVLVWQTSSRRETAIAGGRLHTFEPHAGTFMTSMLSYCVIVAAASVLHLPRPLDMTTRQAALALAPAAGGFGPILFAIGIIGAGMVALPVLVASMCYSVSEAAGWRSGLSEHPWEAGPFYVLISASVLIASLANFVHINPVKALYLSQVLAGVLTVPILVFILMLANDRRVMRTTNSRSQNFWMGATIGALIAAQFMWLFWQLR
jgi:Mn2+/Fe2+ NRAMP family transporter